MQHTVRHHEAVIKMHHGVRRQIPNPIIFAFSPALHALQEIILRDIGIEPHGGGVVMRRINSGIIEGIDVVDFPF